MTSVNYLSTYFKLLEMKNNLFVEDLKRWNMVRPNDMLLCDSFVYSYRKWPEFRSLLHFRIKNDEHLVAEFGKFKKLLSLSNANDLYILCDQIDSPG